FNNLYNYLSFVLLGRRFIASFDSRLRDLDTAKIINIKISVKGSPARSEAACKLLSPPANINEMVRKPRSRPHNTFNLVEGFSVLPDVIPATKNVAESADVTRNVNIWMIAIIDVILVIEICPIIVNCAADWSASTLPPMFVL